MRKRAAMTHNNKKRDDAGEKKKSPASVKATAGRPASKMKLSYRRQGFSSKH